MEKLEKLKLVFFTNRLKRLRYSGLGRRMLNGDLNVTFWEKDNGEIHIEHPSIKNDEIDAFLLNFRLLQQNNDSVSIRNISTLIANVADKRIVDEWMAIRQELNSFLDKDVLPKDLPSISTREFIDSFLYGVYAHVKVDKYMEVSKWRESVSDDDLNTSFLANLHMYLEIISKFIPLVDSLTLET